MWSKIGRALPYAILYIAAVAIVGLFNILTIEYQDNILSSAEFWNRVVSQNLSKPTRLNCYGVYVYCQSLSETDNELYQD
jgi:hypothetical protein